MPRVLLLALIVINWYFLPDLLTNFCLNVSYLVLVRDPEAVSSATPDMFARCAQWQKQPGRIAAVQGHLALLRGEHGDAIAFLTRAEALGNATELLHWQRGNAYEAIGDIQAALGDWRAAHAASYFLARGLALRHQKDWKGAEKALRQATWLEPDNPLFARTLGEFYWEWDKLGAAQNELRRALTLETQPYERALLEGEVSQLSEQRDAAISAYQRAVELNRVRAEAYQRLANLYVSIGQPQEAITTLTIASQRATPVFGINLRLGQLLSEQGEYAAADAHFALAQAADPQSDESWLARAQNAFVQGHYSDAEQYLYRALAITPNNAETHFWLGRVFAQTANCAQARRSFARARMLAPDDPRLSPDAVTAKCF